MYISESCFAGVIRTEQEQESQRQNRAQCCSGKPCQSPFAQICTFKLWTCSTVVGCVESNVIMFLQVEPASLQQRPVKEARVRPKRSAKQDDAPSKQSVKRKRQADAALEQLAARAAPSASGTYAFSPVLPHLLSWVSRLVHNYRTTNFKVMPCDLNELHLRTAS